MCLWRKKPPQGTFLILHLFFCWDEMNQIPFLWYLALVSGCSYSISRNKYSNQLRPVPAVNKENSELFSSFLVLIYCLFLLLAIHIVQLFSVCSFHAFPRWCSGQPAWGPNHSTPEGETVLMLYVYRGVVSLPDYFLSFLALVHRNGWIEYIWNIGMKVSAFMQQSCADAGGHLSLAAVVLSWQHELDLLLLVSDL